jgi:hypothetical protein
VRRKPLYLSANALISTSDGTESLCDLIGPGSKFPACGLRIEPDGCPSFESSHPVSPGVKHATYGTIRSVAGTWEL